jgi:two-component system phosphate regulon sensor histidine kinase PhoR
MAKFEFFLIIILLITLVCVVYRSVYLVQGLREIEELIRAFLKGDLRKRLYLERKDSVADIARLLNALAEVYENKIFEANLQRERLFSILRSLPDAIALVGNDEKIEVINPAFESFVGLEKESILGRRLNELIRAPEVFNSIDKVTKTKNLQRAEIYRDDQQRYYETIVCPVQQEGWNPLVPAMVVIFRDITEIKKTDEMRREFVANVSHELKTPITTIKGYTETLLDGALDNREDAMEFLQTILGHTERMERLIRDLISLSRIESGAMRLQKQNVLLRRLIEEVCETFRDVAKRKGLYFRYEVLPPDLTVKADYLRLSQILHNLIDNAIKFTEKGGVVVQAEQREETVLLNVIDTGIGIPARAIPRLGERFFRVDPSRSRALGGTGLGLAIVKHLIKAHGWQMEFVSEEGRGTVVKIMIRDVKKV